MALQFESIVADPIGTEPTSLTDPGAMTRRAFIGGPNVVGAADPLAAYYTGDVILTPPGSFSATLPKGVQNGATGAKTSASYAVGIAPLLPGGGGTMGMLLDKEGQAITKGQKILNPFGTKKRACMCPMGKCTCL